MNRPAIALASIALLGGAWWLLTRDAADTTATGDAGSSIAPSFDLSWLDLASPILAIPAAVETSISDLVGIVTPEPVNASANVAAFLRAIRLGEGTSDPDGYRRIFGGQLVDSLATHPRIRVPFYNPQRPGPKGVPNDYSTAAGAYQALSTTWDDFIRSQGAHDFSPASQDEFAVWAVKRRGALADVKAGRFDIAVRKCASEWASLPGSPYGQPTVTLAQVRGVYEAAGGTYA